MIGSARFDRDEGDRLKRFMATAALAKAGRQFEAAFGRPAISPAIFYRPNGSGFSEVARVNADGSVRICDLDGVGRLSKRDLVSLCLALAATAA